jgi:hypothetical protein
VFGMDDRSGLFTEKATKAMEHDCENTSKPVSAFTTHLET